MESLPAVVRGGIHLTYPCETEVQALLGPDVSEELSGTEERL